MPTIRSATKADRRAITATWVAAFSDDPVTLWLCERPENMPRMFDVAQSREYSLDDLDVAVEDDQIVACASWHQPGVVLPSMARQLISVPFWAWALRSGLIRGNILQQMTYRERPKFPHLYLGTIGSAERGQGYGSALLAHRLEGYDGAAYLESSKEENIPLYERFGFRVTQELQIPDGPKLWSMLREARPR